ncbi:MAG: TIGR04282 family arsenosugar biosynthesis glycosyltransferase [Bacteroidota bacterium]
METKTKDLLIIFTKNPEIGKVKTRLAKDVGDEAALEIYKFLLKHTISVTKSLDVQKEVWFSEGIDEDQLWDPSVYSKKLQKGKDLGARMQYAFEEGFENGFRNIIIIGSDMYDLETSDLENAFILLKNKEYVIGPAADGGYYLLGMRTLEPKIFQNKEWGTSTVLHETLNDLKGKNIALTDLRNDVDLFTDIKDHEDFQKFFKK